MKCFPTEIVFLILSFCPEIVKGNGDCICSKCSFDNLLDNCTSIFGHIQIGLEAEMLPIELIEFKLKNVTEIIGCVTIANSGLTEIKFLSNLKIIKYSDKNEASSCSVYGNVMTIAKNSLLRKIDLDNLSEIIPTFQSDYGIYLFDNPSLCITENQLEFFLKTKQFYAPHITICDANKSKKYCSLDSLDVFNSENLNFGCKILTNSLVLNGTIQSSLSVFSKKLKTIEQIFGSIIILNTNLKELKFPKLWRIYNYQPTLPVILIQKNSVLSSIDFSSLKSIPYSGNLPEIIYAYENPNLIDNFESTCTKLSNFGEIIFDGSNQICDNRLGKTTKKSVATSSSSPSKNKKDDFKGNSISTEDKGNNSTFSENLRPTKNNKNILKSFLFILSLIFIL